jgi:uncharacterized PurR-regulated membrane protein YhhQ (DUF165 family)
MTTKRIVLATLAAFVVSQMLAGYIHGLSSAPIRGSGRTRSSSSNLVSS